MENEKLDIDTIFQWRMTTQEIEVFKLVLAYDKAFKKLFADAPPQVKKLNSVPVRTDPRKANIFRQCWKMRRETRGLLEGTEYANYIYANLLIIKLNDGRVQPNCVCGDKAWVRYKVWKRRFDQKMAELSSTAPPPSVSTTNPKIIGEIDRTKKFLFERCEGEVTFDKIKNFVDEGIFKFWVASGKVSPYYVVMSPFIAKAGDVDAQFAGCSSSPAVVREKITSEVKDYFKHEYRHEFDG